MTVDEFIERIEDVHLEDALKSLSANPKDLVMIYLSAKEFQRAKLMRGNAIPNEGVGDERIVIEIATNEDSRHTEDLDKE